MHTRVINRIWVKRDVFRIELIRSACKTMSRPIGCVICMKYKARKYRFCHPSWFVSRLLRGFKTALVWMFKVRQQEHMGIAKQNDRESSVLVFSLSLFFYGPTHLLSRRAGFSQTTVLFFTRHCQWGLQQRVCAHCPLDYWTSVTSTDGWT